MNNIEKFYKTHARFTKNYYDCFGDDLVPESSYDKRAKFILEHQKIIQELGLKDDYELAQLSWFLSQFENSLPKESSGSFRTAYLDAENIAAYIENHNSDEFWELLDRI